MPGSFLAAVVNGADEHTIGALLGKIDGKVP
jgi:hypothetical protein